MSVELDLDNVCQSYAPPALTLKDVSFAVSPGECLAVVGPSGCGKTTLLRVIAGLEQLTSGVIAIDGASVQHLPCHQRGVALLFQRPALIPQQTVRQNLRWAWTLREPWRLFGRDSSDRSADLLRVARVLSLENDLDRPIHHLSGGQQQRVALGRCLLRQAKLCLLDEPLGHLDAPLRTDLRRQMRSLAQEFRVTTIHVTHDPEEALTVGDRVAVMDHGVIVQIDEPAKIRLAPANRFVAELVHHQHGGMNFLTGDLCRDGDELYFANAFGRWHVSIQILPELRESLCQTENFHASTGKVHIMVGIEVRAVRSGLDVRAEDGEIRLALTVRDQECTSAGNWVVAADERGPWIGQAVGSERFERGQVVAMVFSMDRAYWFDSATGRTLIAPK